MKITKYFLSMAAAVGMIAGCQKPEMIQIAAPEDVKAPVLEALAGPIEITPSNMGLEKVTFSWSAADFGVPTQVNYSLEAARAAAPEAVVTITSGLTSTTAEITYDVLNQILFNDLKLTDGVAEDVTFKVGAKLGEYEKIYSNVITVSCKVTAAEKVYPKLWVVGSYNGWAHDTSNQFIFDFAGTDAVYQGMIDFGEDHASNEFKITGGAWGTDEHSMNGAHDPEAKTISLVAGGGDNINVYQAKRFYHLTFDRALTLTADVSFDQIGVIGGFNDWGADVVMNFNKSKQRFYADVEFAADTEFKFRLDADWTISYGLGADGFLTSDNGANIPAKAGNYRVYLNMNNFGEITYELVAGMYGKDEPVGGGTTEPEPPVDEPVQLVGWGLVGAFTGWADGADVMLASDGTYLVAKGVELEGELKFRKDGAWGTNFGYAEGAVFEANAEIALAQDGANIVVPAGTYDVYLDEANAKAWFINDGTYPGGGAAPVESEWGLIGSLAACNSWTNNIKLYEAGEYYAAKGVTFADGDQFKFRKGETWGTEVVYEGIVAPDAEYACAAGGGNSTISAGGVYDVYLAKSLDKFYVMTQGKTPADAGQAEVVYVDPSAESFVVGFSGSVLGWDDPSFEQNDRAVLVNKTVADEATFAGTYEFALEGLSVAAGDEFKVRINGQWIGVGGATVEGLAVSGSDNFVADEAGTYNVTITFAWDGNAHSDVKAVFASEQAAVSTPDGKQLKFVWADMMDAPSIVDLGVTTPGKLAICYDLAAVYGEEGLPEEMIGKYMQYMAWDYRVEATDAASGVFTIIGQDHFGEIVETQGTYTEWNGTTCVVNFEMLMLENVTMTVAEQTVPVYIEQGGVM